MIKNIILVNPVQNTPHEHSERTLRTMASNDKIGTPTKSAPKPTQAGRIHRLPQAVINRIAAGEVVVRPSAALKELLENSLDANASTITVSARDGGLKLLQVSDNGEGINKQDLPLLCERFATSKIKTFEDLLQVETFGFRGEALASISHVARLSVLTKRHENSIAYTATYADGGLREAPTACAAVNGCTITVEDMFYNLPTRRAALRSPSDEYRAIVDVVCRYAIQNPHVAFVCKRLGASSSSRTADVRTSVNSTTLENIRAAFGSVVSNETIECSTEVSECNAKARAIISSANFSMKKGMFIFFINGRLVDCTSLKRAISSVYASYLPKGGQPFVYVDLKMPQEDVDVNVHPTKKEVRFLHEGVVVDAVVSAINDRLKGTETSRTFVAQSVVVSGDGILGERDNNKCDDEMIAMADGDEVENDYGSNGAKRQRQTYFDTDLDAPSQSQLSSRPSTKTQAEGKKEYAKDIIRTSSKNPVGLLDRYVTRGRDENNKKTIASTDAQKEVRRKRNDNAMPLLTSVETLLERCRRDGHKGLMVLLKEHSFVGIADDRFGLIQHSSRLLLAELDELLPQLVYQQALARFGDHDIFELRPGAPLLKLLQKFIENKARRADDDDMILSAESMLTVLLEKGKMLEEYFGIVLQGNEVETMRLTKLPMFFTDMIGDVHWLGEFVHDVVVKTDWSQEEGCFHGIAQAFGKWYGRHWTCASAFGSSGEGDRREWILNHVLFTAMRSEFWPAKKLFARGVVREITSTAKLYKIFERC